MRWTRHLHDVLGRALANRKPVPPPPPLRRAPTIGSAKDQNIRSESASELEALRVFVWECEAGERLNDRIDLAVRVRGDG